MKKYSMICLVLLGMIKWSGTQAQSVSTAQQVAGHIAQKMQDSLFLTPSQRSGIYQVNLQLIEQKAQVRKRYTSADSLRVHLQKVENMRDELYRPILVSEEKYQLYKKKKGRLVSAN